MKVTLPDGRVVNVATEDPVAAQAAADRFVARERSERGATRRRQRAERLAGDVFERAMPGGILFRPLQDVAITRGGRQEAARIGGEATREFSRIARSPGVQRAIRDPASLLGPAAALGGRIGETLRREAPRAVSAAPGAIASTVRQAPAAIAGAVSRAGDAGGAIQRSADRAARDLAASPYPLDDMFGGVETAARGAGDIGAELTYAPYVRSRQARDAMDVAELAGDEQTRSDAARTMVESAGQHGMNLAFAAPEIGALGRIGRAAPMRRAGARGLYDRARGLEERIPRRGGAYYAVPGAIGAGALALGSGDAEAQETSEARSRVRDLRGELNRFKNPQNEEDIRANQRILRGAGLYDGPIDGIWAGRTQAAAKQYVPDLESRLRGAEEQEAFLSTRPGKDQEFWRGFGGMAIPYAGGALAGLGARGLFAQILARGPNRLLRRRGLPSGASVDEASRRASNVNEFARLGGAGEGTPFVLTPGQAPGFRARSARANPRPADPSTWFQPSKRLLPTLARNAPDIGVASAGAGEVGLMHVWLQDAHQEVEDARAAIAQSGGKTRANYIALNAALDKVATLEAWQRAGIGLAGGSLLGLKTISRARPNVPLAERETMGLNRYLAEHAAQARAQAQAARIPANQARAQAQSAAAQAAQARTALANARAAEAQARAERATAQAEIARLRARAAAAKKKRPARRPREPET